MNACGLFISVFVGEGSTDEYVYLPSPRLLLEKLSFPDLSMKCREVPGDWSLSVAVNIDILSNQLVARQIISASSHPTKKQTSKQRKSPLKDHGKQVSCPTLAWLGILVLFMVRGWTDL